MNKTSRGVIAAALSVLLVAAAHAAPARKASKPQAQPVPAAAPAKEIELVHNLGADKGAQLQKLVDRFNAANPQDLKIVLSGRAWNDGALPHMMILGESELPGFLSSGLRYRPLFQVMKEAGEHFDTLKAPAMMAPTPLDGANRLVALPIGLSSPVMFYNKKAFKDAGVNPADGLKTWQDLQGALGKLVANGSTCPYTTTQPAWILVENTSAWHNEPVVAEGKRSALAINGMLEVKHVAMLSSWVKARYLQFFGSDAEATEHFVSGDCAVMTAASADWPTLRRQAGFEVGVAALPYHFEYYGAPQNTLADGPALWVGAGKRPAEYKTVARFIHMWLTPESQIEWQVNAGYLPLNQAGLLASSQSTMLGTELEAIHVAILELTNKPVTRISAASSYPQRAAIRQIVNEELESVWQDRKPSKLALDDAVARSRSMSCSPSC